MPLAVTSTTTPGFGSVAFTTGGSEIGGGSCVEVGVLRSMLVPGREVVVDSDGTIADEGFVDGHRLLG